MQQNYYETKVLVNHSAIKKILGLNIDLDQHCSQARILKKLDSLVLNRKKF